MLPCECIFLCSQVSARAWDPSACLNECSEKDISVLLIGIGRARTDSWHRIVSGGS